MDAPRLPLCPSAKKLLALAQRHSREHGLLYVSSKEIAAVLPILNSLSESDPEPLSEETRAILLAVQEFNRSLDGMASFQELASGWGMSLLDSPLLTFSEFLVQRHKEQLDQEARRNLLSRLSEGEKLLLEINEDIS